ncbi:hypothetical protein [Azohydromonas lata]|uniref:Uncharacterized protein n=1 Tax=Azohydromonas lata TaxID=45677 RepID=A0ABU5IR39_9BURK|nr:hypothetical protein [Azohydromonas lata]MDZ5461353.1 hypothetical protein [Azohydromonas lata]
MKSCVQAAAWRPALLRGVVACPGGGLEAVVSLAGMQFLRVPVPGVGEVWSRLIGTKVWVDVQRHRVCADVPVPPVRHGA